MRAAALGRTAALPEPVEATRPPEARGLARDGVRLLVATSERLRHALFSDLPELLAPGDLLVVNASATLPASLRATRPGGAEVSLNLSTPVPFDDGERWVVELRRDGARVRDGFTGERLALPGGAEAELLAPYLGHRLWIAAFALPRPLLAYLERHGGPIRYGHLDSEYTSGAHAAEPRASGWPMADHQTIFATEPGSAEMPSAGRPFTPELVTRLLSRGIDLAPIVLHTGVSSLERGETPYAERFRVAEWAAARVNEARRRGGRVIAVGTTVVRALESAAAEGGAMEPAEGWTELVIGPDRPVRSIDGLLTGFHDSDSSHLWMLAAIAGPELIERSQRAAARAGYLRHEFGDVQLLLP